MSTEKLFWCNGCFEEKPEKDGISFDGYNVGLCAQCNATLTPFQRCLLAVLSTTSFDGGPVGIGATFEGMDKTLRRLFRVYHGHDADSVCRQCDPHEYQRQAEARRKAAERKQSPPPGENT